MTKLIIALVALMAAALTAAAQSGDSASVSQPALAGSQWQLVSMQSDGVVTPALPEAAVTLDFASGSEITGSGGCNSYSGTYSADRPAISFGAIRSTKMACADDALTQLESAYFTALGAATAYELSGSRLVLTTGSGTLLRFAARGAYALAGSEWELIAYGLPDAETAVVGSAPLTLTLVDAANASAFGGCNNWTGTYTADDQSVAFTTGAALNRACVRDLSAQEAAYFALLTGAVSFELRGDQLTLRTADGQFLRFVAAGEFALLRAEWRLSQMVVEGDMAYVPLEGSTVSLVFNADGTVGGSSGCNAYGGEYTLVGDQLTFGMLVSTLMACLDNGLMEQESRYLAALNAVERYQISGGTLTLFTADGSLTFVPADVSVGPDEA